MNSRKINRLKNYDYSSNGLYFVTICTKNRVQYLSEIIDVNNDIVGNAALGVPIVKFTEYGEIVNKNIIKINEIYRYVSVLNYVIMPDHIHLILFVSDYEDDTVTGGTPRAAFPTKSVSQIINGLKSISTKQIGFPIWQKSFHDHIIRNREELRQIWQYIDNNPILKVRHTVERVLQKLGQVILNIRGASSRI